MVPYEKVRDPNKAFGWSTWLDKVATNADGTRVIKEIFGEKVFDTPKPVALIEWVIGLSGSPDCIVLDSFGGSGTTAHAVLSLNKNDEIEMSVTGAPKGPNSFSVSILWAVCK